MNLFVCSLRELFVNLFVCSLRERERLRYLLWVVCEFIGLFVERERERLRYLLWVVCEFIGLFVEREREREPTLSIMGCL